MARYAAVFLVMMSNLLLELLLTRVFSATMWYHFAFMAVSVALFGTTVGAVVVHLWPQHFRAEQAWPRAAQFALLYAGALVVCMGLQLRLNITFGSSAAQIARIAALYVLVALPFTFSGVFICIALLRAGDRLATIYAADLLGGAAGCALFVPFMAYADGPRAVLWLSAMAALGAFLLARSANDRRTAAAALVVAGVCVAAFALHLDRHALRVRWAKGYWDGGHAYEKWSAFSRIVVDPAAEAPFGWGMGTRFQAGDQHAEQKTLVIDGAALTVLTRFDGNFEPLQYLTWDVTALAHAIRPHGAVLVVGVGGGRDVLTALAFGHAPVIGVEVNGDILRLLDGPFAQFTGTLGARPDVELVHDEGRSYAARSPRQFAVVQASLVDTWAAAANGAYVLAENALYTREGLRIFLDRLTTDGVVSLSRWYYATSPGETLRLVSLAANALRQRGSRAPQQQLFLARSGPGLASVATLLVATRPFTAAELTTLRRWCADKGFDELLGPGYARLDILAQLAGPEEPTAVLAHYPVDLSAPTDDRPFFFSMLRLRDVFRLDRDATDVVNANSDAVVTLGWLLVLVIVLSATFIVGPLWWRRAPGISVDRALSRFVYFGCIGLGFILIELALMQRLMIALGHPVYGLTVVLFALLSAAGCGSLVAQWLVQRGVAAAWLLSVLVVLLVVATATAAGGMVVARLFEGAATWLRIAAASLLLVPLGLVLGMPLAIGMHLGAADPSGHRALYWGVNGAASVCGSVLATILSLMAGITVTYAVGMVFYAVALGVAALAFGARPAAPQLRPEAMNVRP